MWIKSQGHISKRTRLVNLERANYIFIEEISNNDSNDCKVKCVFDDDNDFQMYVILYVGTLSKCEVYIENVYLFLHDELHGTAFVQED